MQRVTSATIILIAILSGLLVPLQAAIVGKPDAGPLPQPAVDLQPGDVVRIVIEALGRNDRPWPNAGIETTFNFASPANKVNTGPLERFIRMVKGPPYGIMAVSYTHLRAHETDS